MTSTTSANPRLSRSTAAAQQKVAQQKAQIESEVVKTVDHVLVVDAWTEEEEVQLRAEPIPAQIAERVSSRLQELEAATPGTADIESLLRGQASVGAQFDPVKAQALRIAAWPLLPLGRRSQELERTEQQIEERIQSCGGLNRQLESVCDQALQSGVISAQDRTALVSLEPIARDRLWTQRRRVQEGIGLVVESLPQTLASLVLTPRFRTSDFPSLSRPGVSLPDGATLHTELLDKKTLIGLREHLKERLKKEPSTAAFHGWVWITTNWRSKWDRTKAGLLGVSFMKTNDTELSHFRETAARAGKDCDTEILHAMSRGQQRSWFKNQHQEVSRVLDGLSDETLANLLRSSVESIDKIREAEVRLGSIDAVLRTAATLERMISELERYSESETP